MEKYSISCDKSIQDENHFRDEFCPFCFLEQLSDHVEFRNGIMILKNVKIE